MNRLSTTPDHTQTDRLVLRFPKSSDAADIHRLADSPKLALMTGTIPSPYPLAAAVSWIERVTEMRARGEILAYVVCARDSGELMGVISLTQFSGQEANLAYWLGEPYWGHGYCSEAGRGMLEIAFGPLGLEKLVALHLEHNHPSGRVLKRLGFRFTEEKTRPHRGAEALFYCYEAFAP